MIQAGLLHLHGGSLGAGHEIALEHGCRVVGICLLFGSGEFGESCAVALLVATVVVKKVELLAAFKDDVLLVHTLADSLVDLVETSCHDAVGLDFVGTGSRTCYIETVNSNCAPIDIVFVFLAAGNGEKGKGSNAE